MTRTAQDTPLTPDQRGATATAVPVEGLGAAARRAFAVARATWGMRPVAARPPQSYGETDGQ